MCFVLPLARNHREKPKLAGNGAKNEWPTNLYKICGVKPGASSLLSRTR